MSLPEGKQTPPQESMLEPTLLAWSNDYVARQGINTTWHETAVFDNGDGTRTVYSNLIPMAETPQPGATDTPADEQGRSNDSLTHDNAEWLDTAMHGPVGPALRTIGLDARRSQSSMYEIDYLAPEDALPARLAWIGHHTGFAPTLRIIDRLNATAQEQADAATAHAVIASTDPRVEQHDMTFHYSWLLLPESTFSKVGSRSQAVLETRERTRTNTTSPLERQDAIYAASNHFRALETTMSYNFVRTIADCMNGKDDALDQLRFDLGEIMYGNAAEDPKHKRSIAKEAAATLARVQELAKLDPLSLTPTEINRMPVFRPQRSARPAHRA